MNKDDLFFRLLCVDDNLSLQRVLKVSLEGYGFEVITASHGLDALMQYKAHSGKFRAVITDNDMPYMNGLELVRSLREMGFQGRIIVISGHFQSHDLQTYQNYSISGFFHKPFEMNLLAAILLQR